MFRLQLLVGSLGFIGLVLAGQIEFAFALLYGVALMVANAVWLAHRLEKTESLDVEGSQRSLYQGAVIRFVALLAGTVFSTAFESSPAVCRRGDVFGTGGYFRMCPVWFYERF